MDSVDFSCCSLGVLRAFTRLFGHVLAQAVAGRKARSLHLGDDHLFTGLWVDTTASAARTHLESAEASQHYLFACLKLIGDDVEHRIDDLTAYAFGQTGFLSDSGYEGCFLHGCIFTP